ncbi:CaiB/BaiF CoA transferase family protein [Ferrovibrio sp.]|uniref:CaiB/BaiF CoA transferase family protein n=1 Tax=Ferrovibrio sp. TaxID=1917215 RepID=UPI003D13EB23
MAAMLLADLGAEILRIEAPFKREPSVTIDRRADIMLRGRRTLMLDLKQPADRDYLLDLCGKADFLIEGFRPGVMERLGLGPEDTWRRNPKLVFGRMTGWGQSGPLAQRAGHDINYIALAGALHPIGPAEDVPPPPLNLVGDNGGGAMFLAFGVLAAYIEAQRSGQGQVVDAAIVDGTAALMAPFFSMLAAGTWKLERQSNMIDGAAPWYRAYRTADGQFIAIGAIETKFYGTLISRMGLTESDLPDQFDRTRWPELERIFAAVFASRTRDEWVAILESEDACFAPILNIAEMSRHPHVRARSTVVEHQGVLQPAPAPRFSRTPGELQQLSHEAAWDCDDLLRRWGVPPRC